MDEHKVALFTQRNQLQADESSLPSPPSTPGGSNSNSNSAFLDDYSQQQDEQQQSQEDMYESLMAEVAAAGKGAGSSRRDTGVKIAAKDCKEILRKLQDHEVSMSLYQHHHTHVRMHKQHAHVINM